MDNAVSQPTVVKTRWGLGSKLAVVGLPFLMAALLSSAATLWVSWQLDGGAAAVNEAGRMRMQAYRMALVVSSGGRTEITTLEKEFSQSLFVLRHGDTERPLFMPWDEKVRTNFANVQTDWAVFKSHWLTKDHPLSTTEPAVLRAETVRFVADIDTLVASIEAHMARWTSILHLLQMGVLSLAIFGATVLIFTGYRFVLEPVNLLKGAIQKIQAGDWGARVERVTSDEFGTLADGFNTMAEHLQRMYHNLEAKVKEKTLELEEKRERLESLYEVTAMVANATSLETLAQDFSKNMLRIARADAVAVRWSDQANQRFIMLPINRWNEDYERVLLGGLTCDSDDYYNSEQHSNAIYLPKFDKNHVLYIGFFNTGAYQETIGGFGGLKHCLIPEPKHILIRRDENGSIQTQVFSEEQTAQDYLKILGY